MDYLWAAYAATFLILGLAAWRLRAGLKRAAADEAALGDAALGKGDPDALADGA
ncbi:MAG: hypothetical protein IPL60_13735 [Ardenticatenia bacterium]|nr:hypothetical protein [Ardenticatenia bacterium]